jgi:hypothetical protein
MAELADALALGASGRKAVQVQVLFSAPSFSSFFFVFSSVSLPIAFSMSAGVGWTYFLDITMLLCPANRMIVKALQRI